MEFVMKSKTSIENKTSIDRFYSDFGIPPFFAEGVKTDIPFKIKDEWIRKDKLKVLFGHFSPFVNGIGSIDFPLFFSKIFPNATVHVTYDKGMQHNNIGLPPKDIFIPFEIGDNEVLKTDKLDSEYDIIIGRSSVFNKMCERPHHKELLEKSSFKVNIKPIRSWNRSVSEDVCDLVFDDNYGIGSTPSPIFRNRASYCLENIEKQDLILFCGNVAWYKNQLNYVKTLDPDLCKDYSFLFVGETISNPDYCLEIENECKRKGINYYMVGWVKPKLIPYFTTISKLHVINSDPRQTIEEPYDPLPRAIGECVVSDIHTLCSKTTLYSPDLEEFVTQYDHESYQDLNDVFEKSLSIDATGYSKKLGTLEEKCQETIEIIMGEYNGKF